MSDLKDLLKGPPRLMRRWHADIGDHVIAVAWSPSAPLLAAASVSGPITLFDAASGQVKSSLPGHGFGTTALAWRGDGSLLASAGQDGKVRLWDSGTGQERAALAGGAAWVEHLTWHPTLDVLASAAGRKLRLWSAEGQLLHECPDHPATIADLAWRPRTGELTSAAYGEVLLWDVKTGASTRKLEGQGPVLKLAWAPSGDVLAHGNQDATVHYWIMKTGRDLEMSGYPLKVRELAWDHPGTYLATGGGPMVTVWDCSGKGPSGKTTLSMKGHDEPLTVLAFQGKGPLLLSGGQDGRVLLFQPGKYKKGLAEVKLDSAIAQAVWAPDDRAVAVGTEEGMVVVYGAS
jgi:WD40 repeat protein